MDRVVFETSADAGVPAPTWRDVIQTMRVLDEDHCRALVQAAEIGDETNRKLESAKKILADAEAGAGQLREAAVREGRAEGLRSGYEEGFQKGREEGRAALDLVSQRWRQIGDLFEAGMKDLIERQEALLINYAAFLAERFLRQRLEDATVMSRHLQDMIEDDLGKRCLVVTVHPHSAEAVRRAAEQIPALAAARVEIDRKLEIGDMLLAYERQVVDGRVGTMLGSAASVFLQQVLKAR